MTLFRMKLHGKDISAGNRASKRRWIVAARGGHVAVLRNRIEAVREIETLPVRNAAQQRVRAALAYRTPAHVGNLQSLPIGCHHGGVTETNDAPREHTETVGRPLLAAREKHLQAETDAEERPVVQRFQHDVAQAAFVEAAHAIGHGALAREHHAGGGTDYRRIVTHHYGALGGDMFQRLRNRAQIAHSVVDYRYIRHQYQELVSGVRSQTWLLRFAAAAARKLRPIAVRRSGMTLADRRNARDAVCDSTFVLDQRRVA